MEDIYKELGRLSGQMESHEQATQQILLVVRSQSDKLEKIAVVADRLHNLQARVEVVEKDVDDLKTLKHRAMGMAAATAAIFTFAAHWAAKGLYKLFQ